MSYIVYQTDPDADMQKEREGRERDRKMDTGRRLAIIWKQEDKGTQRDRVRASGE